MKLEQHEQNLLEAVGQAVHGQTVAWAEPLSSQDWARLMALARDQKVMPLVYHAVYTCPAVKDSPLLPGCRRQVILQVSQQAIRSEEFLKLYQRMLDAGLHPLVVKGILCRELYPQGDCRPSGDEDLYVSPGEFDACCAFLRQQGMLPTGEEDPNAYEIGWRKPGSVLHIELHRSLFPPESEAFGHLQNFFQDAVSAPTEYPLSGGNAVYSLSPHDHMLYLLLHAYKHFIHSGFGIRQVCDIGLWAARYHSQIHWQTLAAQCREVHALTFARGVLGICAEYLGIRPELPPCWAGQAVPCLPMLKDLLSGGIYGTADISRLHSATVTLEAVESRQQRRRGSLMSSLFPPRKALMGRFPWLGKFPWLLPGAWFLRLMQYAKELLLGRSSAGDTLRIASERKALLKFYDIL